MKKRIIKVVSYIIAFFAFIFGYYFFNKIFHIGIPCIFNRLTGLKCPGCGVTRAFFALIQGDFKTAFCLNKVLFIALPYIIIYYIYKSYYYIIDKKSNKKIDTIFNILSVLLIILLIVYGIIRNI